jgi:hypothetical protein
MTRGLAHGTPIARLKVVASVRGKRSSCARRCVRRLPGLSLIRCSMKTSPAARLFRQRGHLLSDYILKSTTSRGTPEYTEEFSAARKHFYKHGVARFGWPLSVDAWTKVKGEVIGLKGFAYRKRFRNVNSGNTLRAMATIGRAEIAGRSSLIPRLYQDPALLHILEEVVGATMYPVPVSREEFVINWLQQLDDTQGMHRDTYAYGVVLVVEAPGIGCGGVLEVWGSSSLAPVRVEVTAGDCIIIKADSHRHRVSPLLCEGSSRLVLSFVYGASADAPTLRLMQKAVENTEGSGVS